jgi:hypothetical protein
MREAIALSFSSSSSSSSPFTSITTDIRDSKGTYMGKISLTVAFLPDSQNPGGEGARKVFSSVNGGGEEEGKRRKQQQQQQQLEERRWWWWWRRRRGRLSTIVQ